MDIETLTTKYSDELSYLQSVLTDLDISLNESILIIKIEAAYKAISRYLNLKEDDSTTDYFDAACELALVYYTNSIINLNKADDNRPVTQESLGSASITYASASAALDSFGLTAEVKALLPMPKLKLL